MPPRGNVTTTGPRPVRRRCLQRAFFVATDRAPRDEEGKIAGVTPLYEGPIVYTQNVLALTCWLLSLNSKVVANGKTPFAISEIVVTTVVLFAVILLNGKLPRAGFTFLFAVWVSLLAIGVGPVSKLLSIGVLQLSTRWELEFYVLHQPVIRLATSLLSSVCARKVYVLVAFIATAALAIAFIFIQGRIHKMGRGGSIRVHER